MEIKCLFCGKKGEDKDISFVRGMTGEYICNECIEDLMKVKGFDLNSKKEEKAKRKSEIKSEITNTDIDRTPLWIKERLDAKVIGQEYAKKILSVAAYNYYKRARILEETGTCDIDKSNVLLIGPTGTGKTYLTETLAEIMDVPFVSVDITTYSEAGYKGNDISDMIKALYNKTEDIELTEKGIILIDEIDKIKMNPGSHGVSDIRVQQGLLKIIEGTDVTFNISPYEEITLNTKNILFICAGAFPELEDIIKKRKNKNTGTIGFSGKPTESKNDLSYEEMQSVTTEDLCKYGLSAELIGRLHQVAMLHKLEKEDLERIITEPENSIFKQYKKLMKIDGVVLEIERDALGEIANKCLRNKTGARGIKTILDKTMMESLFLIPSDKANIKKCIVTKKSVNGLELPKCIKKGGK